MSTTTIFVEILLIGIQSFCWLFLLFLTGFGSSWISTAVINLKDYSAIVFLFFVTLSYTLGIVFDRIYDCITEFLRPQDFFIKIPLIKCKSERVFKNNRSKLLPDENKIGYFNYVISRARVARPTFYNTFMFWIAFFIYSSSNNFTIFSFKYNILVVLVIGIASTTLTFVAYMALQLTYDTMFNNTQIPQTNTLENEQQ